MYNINTYTLLERGRMEIWRDREEKKVTRGM